MKTLHWWLPSSRRSTRRQADYEQTRKTIDDNASRRAQMSEEETYEVKCLSCGWGESRLLVVQDERPGGEPLGQDGGQSARPSDYCDECGDLLSQP